MKPAKLASMLLAGASALSFASFASAQVSMNPATNSAQSAPGAGQTGPSAPPVSPNSPTGSTAAQPAEGTVSTVTITGSRVIQNGNNSPTPVTVVSPEQIMRLQPTTIADALNQLPVFSGSRSQTTNSGNGYSIQPSAPNSAAAVMNLRNLGFTRTLVLVDGHRVPPTSPDGTIDVNMIPEMLLDRVDIVTGGASAVYGSDAVGGVVNFIMNKRFNGLKLEAQAGVSTYGDDRTYKAGIAGGTALFGGRGHFEASYEYFDDEGILSRRSRAWGRADWTIQGGGTAFNPYHLVENTRISTMSFGGLILTGPLAGQQFATNGVLSPFVHGAPTGSNGYESGGDGAYYNSSLKAPLERHQLFSRFDYDLTGNTKFYVDFSGAQNHYQTIYEQQFWNPITIGAQDAYLAPQYQSAMAAAGVSSFKFGKVLMDAPPINPDTFENQWFVNAGLDGTFWDGYSWDFSYIHGETRQQTRINNNVNNAKLYASLDAVINPATGQPVCDVTLTNPGLYPGCVPLNPFGPSSDNSAALNYFLQTTSFTSHTAMDDVTGSVTGAPFSTWAGAVKVALSAEWRRLGYEAVSDELPTDVLNCTGLRYNCVNGGLIWRNGTFSNRSPVSMSVGEAAFETDIPVLKDLPFAQDVSINGAVRFTDYNTTGVAWPWKVGVDWHVNDQLTLRATRSHDIRAPTLNDLYAPTSIGSGAFLDLLTGQSYQALTVQGGNPNLKPEVADTTTAGFVWRPSAFPSFSLAVDAFDITIHNAITNIQGTNPSIQAVCYASGGASPYCALQPRALGSYTNTSPANQVTEWFSTEINVATQTTYGADFEANYSTRILDRPFSLRGLVTYQPHIVYRTPGLQTVDLGGVAFSSNALQASPKIRATIFASYSPVENFRIDLMERWRSDLSWTGDPTQIVAEPKIPSVAYTDVNLSYLLKQSFGQTEVYLTVDNLFNKQPPPAAFIGAAGAVGLFGGFAYGDDPIGRYFTVGVRFKY